MPATSASDGSIRAVCNQHGGGTWAFAFERDGRLRPGWPVALDGMSFGLTGTEPQLVDGRLFVLWDVETPESSVRVDAVDATGSRTTGVVVRPGGWGWSLGRNGVAFHVTFADDWPVASTVINAVDLGGVRHGWPITIAGLTSRPSVGPDGRVYVVSGAYDQSTSRVLAFDSDGHQVLTSEVLPVVADSEWNGAGAPVQLAPPVVAADGTSYLVSGTAVYAIDRADGTVRAGWPFGGSAPLAWTGTCGREAVGAVGCGQFRAEGVTGPNGTLYLPLEADRTSRGGSLVAVRVDGQVEAGWPIVLAKPGAAFWSVAVGPDGTVYGLAVEPEVNRLLSATILALDPAGTILYRRTVMEP